MAVSLMNGGALALTQPQFNVGHIPTYGRGAEFEILGEQGDRHQSIDARLGEPGELDDLLNSECSGVNT